MILLTGATGLVGTALLQRLLGGGADVRCLVRDPRRLGPNRVRVQITLGDLADPVAIRQAVRGVAAVVHLGAAIRDQPDGSIEEINGVATIRLLREAERAGVDRFVFFSAMGASTTSRTRFFRAKALAEQAVLESDLDSRVAAPSIVYAPGDPWLNLLGRMMLLPWMPVSGSGLARYEPIWAEDAAACTEALLDGGSGENRHRFELAGPDELTYEQIVRVAMEAAGRRRPIVHVPLPAVRRGLDLLGRIVGPSVFATWEEAELLEESMTSGRGTQDVRALGVSPKPMREVLGLA
jgi:uncharacterized protein YbjT (DUF2867 family)